MRRIERCAPAECGWRIFEQVVVVLHFLAVRGFVVELVAEAQDGFCLTDGVFSKSSRVRRMLAQPWRGFGRWFGARERLAGLDVVCGF